MQRAVQATTTVADGGVMAFVAVLFTGMVEAAPWTEVVAMITVPYILVRLAIAVRTFRQMSDRGPPPSQ